MSSPFELKAWRGTRAESAFVEGLRTWSALEEEARCWAALAHWDTWWFQRAALDVYVELVEAEISTSGGELKIPSGLEHRIWSFLQLAKAALDALAREINLVYWHVDPRRRLFDPTGRTRWVTFYTVRERLLLLEEFREDPLVRLLEARTRAETADPLYRDLSHLASASLTAPRLIGRVEPQGSHRAGSTCRVRDARIFIPDDPRQWPFTYARSFEVSSLFPAILRWLELFTDEVYEKLDLRIRGSMP
jgi:hypothetical protein